MHFGTLQHFQKSQLELVRLHTINDIKGSGKAFQIFIGQACNQIQMLMDVLTVADLLCDAGQMRDILLPVDCA